MATKKITDLTALGAAPATNDLVPLVDVSDSTDAATGTTKSMTVANLFTSPSFTTPTLGVATATSINGNTFTTGTYTLTGTAGKTLTFSNSLTLAGTDGTTMTFPSTSATIARTDAANTFTGTQTFSAAPTFSLGFTVTSSAGTVTYNANNGASWRVRAPQTELLTLATGATTTNTSGNLAGVGEIKAILTRVNTTITTAANYGIKVTGGNAFVRLGTASTTTTNITAGTTDTWVPAAFADRYNATATTLTVTTNVNPGAGAIRIIVIYDDFVAITS